MIRPSLPLWIHLWVAQALSHDYISFINLTWALMSVGIGSGWRDRLAILRRLAQLSCRKIKDIFWHWHQSSDCPGYKIRQCGWLNGQKDTQVSHTAQCHGKKRSFNIYGNYYCRLWLCGTAWIVFRNWEWKVKMTKKVCGKVFPYILRRICFLNPPPLNTVYVQSLDFKVSNLSQPCVHWRVFVEVKNWTRSVWGCNYSLTHRYHKPLLYDWIMLTIQAAVDI